MGVSDLSSRERFTWAENAADTEAVDIDPS
jgi:hypothetical protein